MAVRLKACARSAGIWIGLAGVVLLLGLSPAAAQQERDHRACVLYGDDPDAKIAACTSLIRRHGRAPAQTRAHYFHSRGDGYKRKHDYDRAIRDFDEAIRLDPKRFPPAQTRAVYFESRGDWYASKGDYDRAIRDYDEAIRLNPKAFLTYNSRGFAYIKKRDYDRAIRDFDEAIRLNPKDYFGYNGRAEAYFQKGEYDRAIRDYDEAIQIFPLVDFLKQRALARERNGDLNGAYEDIIDVLARFPSDAEAQSTGDRLQTALAAAAPAQAASPSLAVTAPAQSPAQSSITAKPEQVATAPVLAPTEPRPAPTPLLTPGAPERRVALVIGNSTYSALPTLINPSNDAEDIAKALKAVGFEVEVGTDLTRTQMEDALGTFSRKARSADTALVYFSGHGLQHNGINYLAPVDARLEDEADLRKLILLQNVIDDLQGASRIRLLFVDACRDNEAVQQLASRLPRTRAAAFKVGLAAASADGTLIAFATQRDRVALDGSGRNSPFTHAFLKHLPTAGLELRTLLTRVRAEVVEITGGAQRPEVSDSLVGEFTFR